MKLSLSWIFDHLAGSWTDYDVAQIVERFNLTTAEIESFEHCVTNVQNFTLGTVTKITDKVTVFCPELNKEFQLPLRSDAVVGATFFLFVHNNDFRWAALADWHAAKDGLICAVRATKEELKGGWKDSFEAEDYILTLENKSITHRPDLWSHRGIAREIGAIFGIKLKKQDALVHGLPVEKHDQFAPATHKRNFSIKIKEPALCKRFAGGLLTDLDYTPSVISIAHRLARVDSKPIDAFVDATNYVMFDLGQPMHAFDADKISTRMIEPMFAHEGQTIELLDKQVVQLTSDDFIISDGQRALALAGVMGGSATGVSKETRSLFIEAGCFDAGTVRKAALRIKKRTESSTRFEKSLDGANTIIALERFLTLLQKNEIAFTLNGPLVYLGHESAQQTIVVAHDFIEKKLGIELKPTTVKKTLTSLGFQLKKSGKNYSIGVPSFRSSKEPLIKEDIVEEIGRFVGYQNIPLTLPALTLQPNSMSDVLFERTIKNYCAYAFRAHEVTNYALYDQEFLRKINWAPADAVTIQNPVSENWQMMVTSLVPHLFKNIEQNKTESQLRFFECNRVWYKMGQSVVEKKIIAGIAFAHKQTLDFYAMKDELEQLFAISQIEVSWMQSKEFLYPWMHRYQTALLGHNAGMIGYAGMVDPGFLSTIAEGQAFIFELDAEQLLAGSDARVEKFVPLTKYPSTWFDVSMLVPLSITVDALKKIIMHADERIFKVDLIDFFQKEEWKDQRSITVRFYARDAEKTLSHEEIDHMYGHVVQGLKQAGAQIR